MKAEVPVKRPLPESLTPQRLVELYRTMLLIRHFEVQCSPAYRQGKMGGYMHVYIGQEAVAAGMVGPLRRDDYVLTSYRDHTQALAKGARVVKHNGEELTAANVGMALATRDLMHWLAALIGLPAILWCGLPFYRSALADNNSFEQWEIEGRKRIEDRANALCRSWLDSYEAPALDPDIDEALLAFIASRKNSMPDAFT